MTLQLFAFSSKVEPRQESLGPGAVLRHGFATAEAPSLLATLQDVIERLPFRHMVTPAGFRMSVAMTNCGEWGWITDRTGYRYDTVDPDNGRPWPRMPYAFAQLGPPFSATKSCPSSWNSIVITDPGAWPDACAASLP
jgi:alkylated DNA repair protein (DNA oxidative demethylase)